MGNSNKGSICNLEGDRSFGRTRRRTCVVILCDFVISLYEIIDMLLI